MDTSVSVIEILGPACALCQGTQRVVQHVVEQAGMKTLLRRALR